MVKGFARMIFVVRIWGWLAPLPVEVLAGWRAERRMRSTFAISNSSFAFRQSNQFVVNLRKMGEEPQTRRASKALYTTRLRSAHILAHTPHHTRLRPKSSKR
ncbi:hypothetical protein T440DRAFT_124605 [Plenodomus tracheiphilus IPT5]|uniref:Secreted protein n=1 Tax=Plenodomus tracheiphilus IPT5 TaxID=1408161 RepID=A0A6A7B5S7_9PLEO|nr:hypothetical protein T440DRAFT_124605 [Plenodomus tracheiphilus IPT5]